jgi:hypothetical protein
MECLRISIENEVPIPQLILLPVEKPGKQKRQKPLSDLALKQQFEEAIFALVDKLCIWSLFGSAAVSPKKIGNGLWDQFVAPIIIKL